MTGLINKAIDVFLSKGWKVERKASSSFTLPPEIALRYPAIPDPLIEFLGELKICINHDGCACFLCEDDYAGKGPTDWEWNFFEEFLLECEESEEDKEYVRAFFDVHFPFLLSCCTGFSFFAICLEPERYGQIAHVLVEYSVEEPMYSAKSFEEFLSILITTLENDEGDFYADV